MCARMWRMRMRSACGAPKKRRYAYGPEQAQPLEILSPHCHRLRKYQFAEKRHWHAIYLKEAYCANMRIRTVDRPISLVYILHEYRPSKWIITGDKK